jgi:hypothetical protein
MHETIKFYVTVRFALSEKLALKTPNVLIKNGVCFTDKKSDKKSLILRYFIERYTVCCGTVRYGALENSDKNGLPTV